MKNKIIESKSIKELKELIKLIDNFDSIEELRENINQEIERKKKKTNVSLNEGFDLEMFKRFHMLQDYQIEFLRQNNILNLQDLIDCDIEELFISINDSEFKKDLLFIREFYDMSNMPRFDSNEKPESKPKQFVKHNNKDSK